MEQYILTWTYGRTPLVAIIFESMESAKAFCRNNALVEQLNEGSIVIQQIH